jgi:spore germination cell wall hydrolase CwlJ-like protein
MKKLLISALLIICGDLGTAAPPAVTYVKHNSKDVVCLAENIYHEARGEPFHGQLAVAQVTINRFQTGKHGKTICATVHERKQFSWTITKPKIRDKKRWQNSVTVAQFMLSGSTLVNFPAQYYHNQTVSPVWGRNKSVLKIIGNHIFYS